MLARLSPPISANKPFTPIQRLNMGDSTKLAENVSPMLNPISDIARVRTSSRVKSASKAVTAALTAPAPCTARAIISVCTSVAAAAQKLPSANTPMPR